MNVKYKVHKYSVELLKLNKLVLKKFVPVTFKIKVIENNKKKY